MEDRDKSVTTKAAGIIDLTTDMIVTDESQVEIIDLTDIVDGPDEIPPPASPVAETPPESEQPADPSYHSSAVSSAIEQQVEAAFDYVQSPTQETAPEPEENTPADYEGLMDKLSDIPQMVDDAVDASGTPDAGMEADADEAAQPADAREADTAIRSEFILDEEDDEIIELTDIVDPSELEAAYLAARGDEEIIELTDIVDPSELEAAGLPMDEDDEIIELTDIVDPAELHVGAVSAEPGETGSAQEAASKAPGQDQEYEDLLEAIDTLDSEDLLVDITDEEDQALESITDEQEAEDAAPAEAEGVPDEDLEYENLLETIDSLDPEDLLVSVDEAGLLGDDDSAGAAETDQEGLVTLTEVLHRHTTGKKEMPPVERVGSVIREVEEETGRDVRTLTDQEVEAAVERILKTKYAETIERLIANAVEKAVNREIENLKRTMLDDD